MFERVVEQIVDHLLDLGCITAGEEIIFRCGDFDARGDAALSGGAEVLYDFVHQRGDADPLELITLPVGQIDVPVGVLQETDRRLEVALRDIEVELLTLATSK